MFLLFGTRASQTIINVVTFVCGYCNVNARQNVVKRTNKFTLFFIPLFPFSTRYHNECTNCGGITDLDANQVQRSLEWAQKRR